MLHRPPRRLAPRLGNPCQRPGCSVADWCWDGAPSGVTEDPLLDDLFPAELSATNPDIDHVELVRSVEDFSNYPGFEVDDGAVNEVLAYAKRDPPFLLELDSWDEVVQYLGSEPILSRFGVLKRWKGGRLKKRVVLDVKESRVTCITRRTHRVVLPRISDAIADALEMMSHLEPGQEVEWLVLDFVDAFWNVPLRHSERRFFTGKIADKFYIFLRAAQGSRNGPLSWAAMVSLALRCAQSLFFEQPSGTPPEARETLRLQTFVDDPVFCIRGSQQARARKMALVVLVWRALGFPLAFQKVARGPCVHWIGCVLKIDVLQHQVTAEIAEEKVIEAKDRVRSSVPTLSPRCALFWVSLTTLRLSFFR